MNTDIVLGSAVVGLLVGMTGSGGGALMTPMLILVFSVRPMAAISSDLVAAVLMRPVGSALHLQRGTVNWRLVGWTSAGSVPAALAGSYLLHLLGHTRAATHGVESALGAALLLGAGGMAFRYIFERCSGRSGPERGPAVEVVAARPMPNLAVGVLGGFVVGVTSVGAGSLMIVLLMFLYPALGVKQVVGTDLVQSIPLTTAAALGALAFGPLQLPLTTAMVLGGVPAAFVGSLLSSRAPDRWLRPMITVVVLASGLTYVGVTAIDVGWVLVAILGVMATKWALDGRRRRPRRPPRPTLNRTCVRSTATADAPDETSSGELGRSVGSSPPSPRRPWRSGRPRRLWPAAGRRRPEAVPRRPGPAGWPVRS